MRNNRDDSRSIDSYLEFIRFQFHTDINKDVVIKEFNIAKKHRAFLAFIDGMADRSIINDFILKPLMNSANFDPSAEQDWLNPENNAIQVEYILKNVLAVNQYDIKTEPQEIIDEILKGNTAIFIDGNMGAITCETKGYEKRNVEKPHIEGVVKGAQEGFTENIRTNTALIRRIVKNKDLVTEFEVVGERNNGLCAIMYIKDLANPELVKEVKRRIKGLKTDFINGSGILEQFIEDCPYSIFPNILSTERPDKTASHLAEGRVAVIVDGTPFAMVMPATFISLIQSPEDTSLRWQYGTLLRLLRLIAIFGGSLLPGLYVSITTFHREMIPTDLLIAIAKARENVPFPTIVEIILMEISFELIREAGIRIPGMIGNTIGIIGALILGQAAVEANLVSPILIIIIAFTGLGNFAIPDFNLAFGIRLLRFIFIFSGAILGFYGISLAIIVILALITDQKSFGVPMMAPFAPRTRIGRDHLIKSPVFKQERRPDEVNPLDPIRQPFISRLWYLARRAKDFYLTRQDD